MFKPKHATPKVGQLYTAFDDGKVKLSRMMRVRIDEVVPYENVRDNVECSGLFQCWRQEVEDCDFLYDNETDAFVLTTLFVAGDVYRDVFVRTKDGGWFGLGLNRYGYCGRLDIDGSLEQAMYFDYEGEECSNFY